MRKNRFTQILGIKSGGKRKNYVFGCRNKKGKDDKIYQKEQFKHDVKRRVNLHLFSTVIPSNISMFLSCRPFVVITALSTGFVGVEVTSVSWLGQLTVGV